MICPTCSSPDVRVSQRTQWNDFFQHLLGCQAYRCRKCRLRFYAPGFAALTASAAGSPSSLHRGHVAPSVRNRRRLIRRLIAVAIFTLMFVIFWFYLRYLTTDRVPADTSEMNSPLPTLSSAHYADESISVAAFDASCKCLSDIRAMYSAPSSAYIQPETAGRGKG
jgi:hypothetical protein